MSGTEGVAPAPSVVVIGFFDGVHLGHRAIIERAVGAAAERGIRSVVVTFDRHPMEVVRPGSQPRLLMTLARRAATLAACGVDLVVVLPFDDELRHLPPEGFVDRVLGSLSARRVVVGANFRFGHKAAGDVTTLRELGAARGFEVDGVGLRELDGVVISSTEVRTAVEKGDVRRAARLLGRPYLVEGVVVRGDRRGETLGFPTANLQVSRRVAVPARGIYAGLFHTQDARAHRCVTSVGVNPTFGGQDLRVESFLLDFRGDLYGASAGVDFRHRIREERRFAGPEELVTWIRGDVARARALLAADEQGAG
ncbi:MAG: bifunctional riboflavin kinase/FAD synthetase [Actinomycetota bacterium]|nr:bifunctional riboflavin kinase/FAD synthetase [Actinomycetota bacterium]